MNVLPKVICALSDIRPIKAAFLRFFLSIKANIYVDGDRNNCTDQAAVVAITGVLFDLQLKTTGVAFNRDQAQEGGQSLLQFRGGISSGKKYGLAATTPGSLPVQLQRPLKGMQAGLDGGSIRVEPQFIVTQR